jgi:hypothetical protein
MPTPIEVYREGYEKGKNDTIGGRAAEVTMGILRDDPGGHFAIGYRDGAAGNAFSPPATPMIGQPKTKGLIPKFSENPFGWFLGVMILIEVWALWQLIKAPFQLIGALIRSEKPSLLVIVKNVIVAGLAVTAVWSVHNANEIRGTTSYTQSVPASRADARLVGTWKLVRNDVPNGIITFRPNGRYEMPHDGAPIAGPYSVSAGILVIEFPEIQFTAEILSADQEKIRLRETKSVDRTQGDAVSHPNDAWDLIRN